MAQRVFDVLVSVMLFCMLAVPLAVVALAIRIVDGSPVFIASFELDDMESLSGFTNFGP